MGTRKGKARVSGRHIDTAAIWQQQQRLQQLKSAINAMPAAQTLPMTVAHEMSRALSLLHSDSSASASTSSSSCQPRRLLSQDAALQAAAADIRNALLQLQPSAAADACVHAHLFAAWVRGLTTAAENAEAAVSSPHADAAATVVGVCDSSRGDKGTALGSSWQQEAACASDPESTTLTGETAAADHSLNAETSAKSQLKAAAAAAPTTASAAATAAAVLQPFGWGPLNEHLTLSSYQYGHLLLQLGMVPLLLDSIEWLQLPHHHHHQQQQQQQQSTNHGHSMLCSHVLKLLAEVCSAVPGLALVLLQQLQHQTAQQAQGQCSSSGSTDCASITDVRHMSALCTVLLLCLCKSAAHSIQAHQQVHCLEVLLQHIQQLLRCNAPRQQQQDMTAAAAALMDSSSHVTLPAAAAAVILLANSANGRQQQQQRVLDNGASDVIESSSTGSHPESSSVVVSRQLLLAALLQLLQDLLLHWGISWYTQAAAAAAATVPTQRSTPDAAATSDAAAAAPATGGSNLTAQERVCQQLVELQKLLQQVLPCFLAAEQQQQQQKQASYLCASGVLPVMSHQLIVQTNSRLALTIIMIQGSAVTDNQLQPPSPPTPTQQQQRHGVAPAAAAGQSVAAGKEWQVMCRDPVSSAAQKLLQQQQQGSVVVTGPNNITDSNTTQGQSSCWFTVFSAKQQQQQQPGVANGTKPKRAYTSASDRLPCSLLTSQQQQQQQRSLHHRNAAGPSNDTDDFTVLTAAAAAAAAVCPCDVANHIAGLAAAWLTPGFNMGHQLQNPACGAGHSGPRHSIDCRSGLTPGSSSSSNGNSTEHRYSDDDLLSRVSAAAATDCYGPLRLTCCLLQMLLHATTQQQQQQHVLDEHFWTCFKQMRRIGPSCARSGLSHVLVAMLQHVTRDLQDPQQQQTLLAALYDTSAPGSSSSSRTSSCWDWLRQQLSAAMQPELAAAAARGLIAASNQLVEKSDDEDDGSDGLVTSVVTPRHQQQALLAAELSRALLGYVVLWPDLTVRRLLTDAIHHRSQQPLVVQLLKGFKAACNSLPLTTAAAAAGAANHQALPDNRVYTPDGCQQTRQQHHHHAQISLLLDELQYLLLPAQSSSGAAAQLEPCSTELLAEHAPGTDESADSLPPQQQHQQRQQLDLTDSQRASAVQLISQLLEAHLLTTQQVLWHLCVLPWQSLWQQQQQQAYPYSHGHLRFLLQLTESLLHLKHTTSSSNEDEFGVSSSVASPWQQFQQQLFGPHQLCRCPLSGTEQTAHFLQVAAAPAPAAAAYGGTCVEAYQDNDYCRQHQQLAQIVSQVLLGLCCIQQLLHEEAWVHHQPDYKGSNTAAALLEATVTWATGTGVHLTVTAHADEHLLLIEEQQQQQQEQMHNKSQEQANKVQEQQSQEQDNSSAAPPAAACGGVIDFFDLQRLSWQQRVLLAPLLTAAPPSASETAAADSSTSRDNNSCESGAGSIRLPWRLLPSSLADCSCTTSGITAVTPAAAGAGGGDVSGTTAEQQLLSHHRQLLLECFEFAAASDQHALLLTRSVQAAAAAEGAPPAEQQSFKECPPALEQVAQLLGAAVQRLSWPCFRRSTLLALGQFLPWAAEHEAARVLLRLLPAQLHLTLTRQQQQQADRADIGLLWSSQLQLMCRAVYLSLVHGSWATEAAAGAEPDAAGNQGSRGGQQAAAEQCFRHLSTLVMHVTRYSTQVTAAGVDAPPTPLIAGSCLSSLDSNPASKQVQMQLVQVCFQELCRLIRALQAHADCSLLQTVLLQLLAQLFDLGNESASPAAPHSAVASHLAEDSEAGDRSQSHENQRQQKQQLGWQEMRVAESLTVAELLGWIGQQFKLLPDQLSRVLVPAVVHLCEQCVTKCIGEELADEQLDAIEQLLCCVV